MQVFCPKCGAGTDVAAGTTRAACGRCGEALPVNMPAFGPPEMGPQPQAFGVEEMAAARVAKTPVATTFVWNEVQGPDGAWAVGLRGGTPGCALIAGIAFVFTTFVGAAQCGKARPGPVPWIMGVLAVYCAYRALCAAVNRATLRLDGDFLVARRGPVPELGNVLVSTSTIVAFDVVRGTTVKTNGTKTVYYVVRAIGSGPPAKLPIGMMPRDQADWVKDRLGQMLADVQRRAGIVPPIVPGVSPS